MNIVFLTGAGISVASGLRTFRGPSGVYNSADVQKLSHVSALRTDPDAVWKFWGAMRAEVLAVEPNAAHRAIAELEQRLSPDDSLTVVTMNVDGLHQRAGSTNVVELHGSLLHSRSTATPGSGFVDTQTHQNGSPRDTDGHRLRPDIVLFGESLPTLAWQKAVTAARYANVFIAVGTSNTVQPASTLVKKPFYKGADTYFINPEIPPGLRYFRRRLIGPAEEVLPLLLARFASVPTDE